MVLVIRYKWWLIFLSVLVFPPLSRAIELEPRRWSHLPINANFVGVGGYYTEADIYFDPALPIENAEMEMQGLAVKYIRTFQLFEKSARIDVMQDFQEGRWKGLVGGKSSSIKRSGLSDSRLRFAINLKGAPPLAGKDFASYRTSTDIETLLGAALVVHFPTGEYLSDKLINLGKNRFTFRPQFGVVHNRGRLSMELTGAAWFYTDNNDFYNGSTLEQDPLFTMQAHLVYTVRPGIWATGSVGYGSGGATKVNGAENDDRRGDLAWALALGFPLTNKLGAKISYLNTRTQQEIGQDTATIALGLSFFW